MKKLIILTLFILLFNLCSFPAYADKAVPTISDDAVVKPGDIVIIEIKAEIPRNSQIQGIQVDFEYSDNFPIPDSSKTTISGNTTTWSYVGITGETLVGFGDINESESELTGKIVFQVPFDEKSGTDYKFKISEAVAATATEEIICTVEKESVLIKVQDDSQSPGTPNNPAYNPPSNSATVSTGASAFKDNKKDNNNSANKIDEFLDFNDVSEKDWFYEGVKFAKRNQLMNGTSDTEFAPNATITRAMLVTVIYRMEGSPRMWRSCIC